MSEPAYDQTADVEAQTGNVPCLHLVNAAMCRGIAAARRDHPSYKHALTAVLIALSPDPRIEIHAFTGERKVVATVVGIRADSNTEIVGQQIYQKATTLIEKILG